MRSRKSNQGRSKGNLQAENKGDFEVPALPPTQEDRPGPEQGICL